MKKLVVGFIAGFLAVLFFHQSVLTILSHVGFVKAGTYSFAPVGPLHVPQVISLAFWGGVWGILFAWVETRFPQDRRYWLWAFLFGAILPTLVAWFVVAPIKGQAIAAGWNVHRMITGLLINGAWGVGTAVFLAAGLRAAR